MEAAPLTSQASKLLEAINRVCPDLAEMKCAHRSTRDVEANWKTIVDNNHECYHCSVSHPDLMAMTDYSARAKWIDDGVTFVHTLDGYNEEGTPFVCEHPGTESLYSFVFPTAIPLFFAGTGGLVLFHIRPTGPQTSQIGHDFYFPEGTSEKAQNEFIDYITKTLAPEDMELCLKVQKGLNSKGYDQGKFVVDYDNTGFSEHHVHLFQSLVYRALVEA